ncbi:MAG: hypothetical protein J1F01_00140 [Oscillospiraceae bacterium]|nr:hypothetical protein [Oscillospiraceae bacterium]
MKFRAILYDDYDLEYDENKEFTLKPWHKNVIFFIIIAALVNILAVFYINSGKLIYFWDNATYWDISRALAANAKWGSGFWRMVYDSIAQQDYNYIAGIPSAVLMRFFGESRLVYVLGLVNMYLIPSYIVIYMLAYKVSKAPKIALTIIILLFPIMMSIAFNGFVDIGGLLICFICFNLYYPKKDKNDGIWRYILIGILLVFVMLWRRWYAFFSVSFLTAMIAECVLFKRKWYKAAVSALVAAAVLVLFFRGFILSRLMQDYGNLYAGYKFSVMTDFRLITRYVGLGLTVILAVCSVAAGIKKKEARTVFMWIQITVCLIMFLSTQTHGQQHLLLYVPSLVMLTLIIIRHITKEWMLVGISILSVLHAVNVYIPRTQPHNIQEIKHLALVPDFSMRPVPRGDVDEILALKRKLDSTVYEGDILGVLASSFTINEDILKNVEPSLGIKPVRDDYIVSLPQVDSRDIDLSALYNVNYVLVVFPAQTHLSEGRQTVVTEAVASFANYADIATAYVEIPECETVIGDMTVKLFYRVREELQSDINAFEARLYH